MIVADDRTELDEYLADTGYTLLLLTGRARARDLHDQIEDLDLEDWHAVFLVDDPTVLDDADEWNYWFDREADRYAVIGGPDNDLVEWGEIEDLFFPDSDEVDGLRVRGLFAIGDKDKG